MKKNTKKKSIAARSVKSSKPAAPNPLMNHRQSIYSREEIAPIAARLLEGDDYPRAVERATKLLEQCDKQRIEAERHNQFMDEFAPLWDEMERARSLPAKKIRTTEEKLRLILPVRFSEMIKHVTGIPRLDRAEEAVAKYAETTYRPYPNWTPAQRTTYENLLKACRDTEWEHLRNPDLAGICGHLDNFALQKKK